MSILLSNVNYIDALQSGFSWTGNSGARATIGYSYRPDYVMPGAMRSGVVAAMNEWSHVANITFKAVSYANSVLDFGRADLASAPFNLSSGTIGVTYSAAPSGSRLTYEAIILDDRYATASSVVKGSTGFFVLMHEIGHALGIEHPGAYGQGEAAPHLPGAEDNLQNSVMSYFNSALVTQGSNPPATPMIYDIAAIQYLYGANTSYNAGANVYTFTGAKLTQTLWDGGGTDMLNATGYRGNASIDLREGIDFHSTIGQTLVWNAFNARIENASTGSGNDSLIGNDLANKLLAGVGNDTITGNFGADSLYGGNNADLIYGDKASEDPDDGRDSLYGEAGNDIMYAGGGNDYANGGIDQDILYLGSGNDTAYGGGGNDTILADAGNDSLFGDAGNDFIRGGAGNDSMTGAAGIDIFYFGAGEAGADTIIGFEGAGRTGGDVLRIEAADLNGNGLLTTADLAAAMTYSGGNAFLDLGGGESIMLKGITIRLVADDFLIG